MATQAKPKRLSITFPEIDPALHRRWKLIARAKDMTMTDGALEAINEWIKRYASVLGDEERKLSE